MNSSPPPSSGLPPSFLPSFLPPFMVFGDGNPGRESNQWSDSPDGPDADAADTLDGKH